MQVVNGSFSSDTGTFQGMAPAHFRFAVRNAGTGPVQTGDAFPFLIFAIHFMGLSSIMGAINIVATILNMRAPGMTLMKMPIFVWTWLITAFLLIASMPVLAGAITMLLTDRFYGTSFFTAAGCGDPVLFKHIFWFFGHP